MGRVASLRTPTVSGVVALAMLLFGRSAQGQVGDARDALPGIVHVPLAGTVERTGAAIAASAGYGYTEGVLGRGDSHDRFFGTLSGSYTPAPWIAFALRLDGRWDHDVDPTGNTNGFVGDPRLFARIGTDLSHGFRVGAQLGVWLPGDQPPSLVLKATTLDLVALAAYAPAGSPLVLAVFAGGRWDNSAKSDPDAAQLTDTARLGLGLNDASGVLSGIGISYHVGHRLELLADVNADWLVGSSAPPALDSPIVAALGARWDANERGTVSLQASLDASPSGRPDLTAPHPLVDVEPLLSASIGIVFRPGAPVTERAPAPPPEETPAPTETAAVPAPTSASFKGRVTSAAGAPLAHAQVRLARPGEEPHGAETDDDGRFELPDIPLGAATLDVQAQGYTTAHRDISVDAVSAAVSIALDPAIPPAQIRGLVRDFAGKPVAATVVIEPLGTAATVRPDGGFEIEVKPGAYEVVITAKGYAPQRRKVTVEPQGVTLLNVDLRSVR